MKQYPSEKQIKEVVEDFDGDDLGHRHRIIDIMGELFHIKWYRVILDEAHAIKNLHSRSKFTLSECLKHNINKGSDVNMLCTEQQVPMGLVWNASVKFLQRYTLSNRNPGAVNNKIWRH